MNRHKIEFIFIAIVLLASMFLFMKVAMNKNEYYEMDSSSIYTIIICVLVSSLFVFNYYILNYTMWANVVITYVVFKLSILVSNKLLWLILRKIENSNSKDLPLGWQYNYKWFEFLFISLIMVIISELIFAIKKRII